MPMRSLLLHIGSLWYAAVLLVLWAITSGAATAFEALHSAERTLALFYGAWWFTALLVLISVNTLASLITRWPYSRKQLGYVVTHLSLIVVFAGAWVTRNFSIDGVINVGEGDVVTEMQLRGSFDLVLRDARNPDRFSAFTLPADVANSLNTVTEPSLPTLTLDGVRVMVAAHFADATVDESGNINPVSPPRRRDRQPVLALQIEQGDGRRSIALQRYFLWRERLGGRAYEVIYQPTPYPLDFAVRLDDFEMRHYPGGTSPRSFSSDLTIARPGDESFTATVSMNRPLAYAGFDFFQSQYAVREGREFSTLTLSHDPGRVIAYTGYIGLMTGMLLVFVERLRAQRIRSAAGTAASR